MVGLVDSCCFCCVKLLIVDYVIEFVMLSMRCWCCLFVSFYCLVWCFKFAVVV